MKAAALILTAWTLGVTVAFADVDIGKPAPDFTAKDIDGKTHKLADYKGKIVVLESYNLDCPFCANHFKTGAMQALQAEITAKGAIWLVVNSSSPKSGSYRSPATAKKEWAAQKMKATAWIDDSDGKVGKAYGLKTTPHMVVIGKDGNVAYVGAIDDKAAPGRRSAHGAQLRARGGQCITRWKARGSQADQVLRLWYQVLKPDGVPKSTRTILTADWPCWVGRGPHPAAAHRRLLARGHDGAVWTPSPTVGAGTKLRPARRLEQEFLLARF